MLGNFSHQLIFMTKRNSIVAALWILMGCVTASAREVKDTLYSDSGDRIILSYNITHTGNQLTVRFTNAQKKLGQSHQKKYKKLDEVAVVFFDRNGNYNDIKFEGIETSAFMVPANATYTRSRDGYFLINDNPTLQFKVAQNEEAQLKLPIYLASYEGKRHYKVFTPCGTLNLNSKQAKKSSGGNKNGGGRNGGGGGSDVYAANAMNIQQIGDQVITSEELVDEGLSPADEALIRINSVKSMLEQATEYPFDEDLTHEASMLRELRFKVTDEEVGKQIGEILALYDSKKKELAGEAKASQQAQAAQQAQAEQAAQARNDSIAAAQVQQSEEEKKNMMWIGGGVIALLLSFMGGKQIIQMVNQYKLQKQQKAMMENMLKMTQQQTGASMSGVNGMPNMASMGGTSGLTGMAGANGMNELNAAKKVMNEAKNAQAKLQQQMSALNKRDEQKIESETESKDEPEIAATPQRPAYRTLKPKPRTQGTPQTPQLQPAPVPQPTVQQPTVHTSLNDAIPAKYKRLAKRGDSSKK